MSSNSVIQLVVAVVVVGWVIYRQMTSRPVSPRRLVVLPLVLTVIGVIGINDAIKKDGSLGSTNAEYLALDLGVTIVFGLLRGAFTTLYEHDGVLWRKGNVISIGLWIVTILARIGIGVAANHAGAKIVGQDGLLLSFGVSLLVQAGLIYWRGTQTGVPFAADPRRR